MTNQPSEKLKPCPFCGGDVHMKVSHTKINSYQAECDCGVIAGAWRTRKEDAAKDWNTRHIPEAVTIALEDIGRIKTLIGHVRFKQSRDAHGKLCMAELDEILEILENTEK